MEDQNTFISENTNNNIQIPGMVSRDNAGLPIHKSDKKRAIFFIDANNWYHNVKRYFDPSEIDIIKLVNLLSEAKNYQVKEIRFYASVPNIEDGENVYYNHLAYLDSLVKKGVKVIKRRLQKFSNKQILDRKKEVIDNLDLCNHCKPLVEAQFLDVSEFKRKEKGIDVWAAIDMLKLSVLENNCDVCVLISGDADFSPALSIIKSKGKEVLTAMTPLGYSNELRTKFPFFIVKETTLLRCFRDYQGRTIK
ncbi:MAG: NYN domain-containing protein [Candidatus Pacearchaeota archaeon]